MGHTITRVPNASYSCWLLALMVLDGGADGGKRRGVWGGGWVHPRKCWPIQEMSGWALTFSHPYKQAPNGLGCLGLAIRGYLERLGEVWWG